MSSPILKVENLSIDLGAGGNAIRLVEDVSFSLNEGEVLGIVGESGSGKSITCRSLLRLLPPKINISSGSVKLFDKELTTLDNEGIRGVRGREIGMIFQNPSSYLNPVMPVGNQIAEVIQYHEGVSTNEAHRSAIEILRQVGIPDPEVRAKSYIHEFSGGMRQRVMIAVGLACKPKILIADEPTTALDVTIQAQILRLLLDLKDKLGISIILITHDLGVVSQSCDRVAVMYAGSLMEISPLDELLSNPKHPYTIGLKNSQPSSVKPGEKLPSIGGQPPNMNNLPIGCRFAPRCVLAKPICNEKEPATITSGVERGAACHFVDQEGAL